MNETSHNINFKELISSNLNPHLENPSSEMTKDNDNINDVDANVNLYKEIELLQKDNQELKLKNRILIFSFLSLILFFVIHYNFDEKKINILQQEIILSENRVGELNSSNADLHRKLLIEKEINILNKVIIETASNKINALLSEKETSIYRTSDLPSLPPLPKSINNNQDFIPPPQLPINLNNLSPSQKKSLNELDFQLITIEKERMIYLSKLDREKQILQKQIELLQLRNFYDIDYHKKKNTDLNLLNSISIPQ